MESKPDLFVELKADSFSALVCRPTTNPMAIDPTRNMINTIATILVFLAQNAGSSCDKFSSPATGTILVEAFIFQLKQACNDIIGFSTASSCVNC